MENDIKKMKKNETIMSVVLVFLILAIVFVIVFVVANKNTEYVIEEPISELDASNYVKLEEYHLENSDLVYKNVELNKVSFINVTEVLLTDFYNKQDEILKSIQDNIAINKQFIDNYNSSNNITDYSANSNIESILLYEIKDDILSVIYVIEDSVDYKEVSNNIINILINLKNNSKVSNETLLNKYNISKEDVVSKVFDSVVDSHDDNFINKDTKEDISKGNIKNKKDEYQKILLDNFDNYIYLYFYQDNLYLKYNKSDISELLFNENLINIRYSTLKLDINQE